MAAGNRVSTGLAGFDGAIDMLRLGDNVVWQVQTMDEYLRVLRPYIKQSAADNRRMVYFRFGSHAPLIKPEEASVVYEMDAAEGFESFATKVHNIIEAEGLKAFYLFDCLSDLLQFWYSDLMIGNFFRVTCPFLYQLDTIAYFALIRGAHTYETIARIRETTQLLLDTYDVGGKFYIHPLKVWERYSPTMFFPHLIEGDTAVSVTSSADTAALFAGLKTGAVSRDYWDITIDRAKDALSSGDEKTREDAKNLLINIMISREPRMTQLTREYFTLYDILDIASREIGTGFIGGKSVGMLLARAILLSGDAEMFNEHWEPHDSYYLGSDIFYTYIVQNGWWELRTKQKTDEHYFSLAPELRDKLLSGRFPAAVRERFIEMLEHFGQSPIIVRSSSLLEDNFGNAFAGKYESVFCANQGSPEERLEAFENAVRAVYASTMSDDALIYRKTRSLQHRDEQMAVLVQRVSGDHYGDLFFPHAAGMGNSSNLYVWNKDMDPEAGMLRLVFGLGTRAVDRVSGDYARIVPLDNPGSAPPVHPGDEKKFSQHKADVLNLRENKMSEAALDDLIAAGIKTDKSLFFSVDYRALDRMRELGRDTKRMPHIADFKKLLTETPFPALAKSALKKIEAAYGYPVDIEFTANFTADGHFRFNLLQCRPLQTKGLGAAVKIPVPKEDSVFFEATGGFMGGNAMLPFDYVIFVKADEYLALPEQEKYMAARVIGMLNRQLSDKSILLAGPGRWGTTTPSLGVPVHFGEICHMKALCEISYQTEGLMPELSFGSHFFQDIVESGIFYAAVFQGAAGVMFNPQRILDHGNVLDKTLPDEAKWARVIHLAPAAGLTLYADIKSQRLACFG